MPIRRTSKQASSPALYNDRSTLAAMSAAETHEHYGTATLEPAGCAIAGAYGSWRLCYTVGARGIATGGAIRIYTESDTDWGIPQLTNPSQAEYMTVAAPSDAGLDVLVEDIKSIKLRVQGRDLRAGESVVVTYGDQAGGGPDRALRPSSRKGDTSGWRLMPAETATSQLCQTRRTFPSWAAKP